MCSARSRNCSPARTHRRRRARRRGGHETAARRRMRPGRLGYSLARHERLGRLGPNQTAATDIAGDRHDRTKHDQYGDRGHEARSFRLPVEAVRAGGNAADDRRGARSGAADEGPRGFGPETLEPSTDAIVGHSPPMQQLYKAIGRVAPTDATVLIRGESGTGKELVARAIYEHSLRNHAPLVVINCAAIPETLLESELFGYEPGAFTGALTRRIGKFEQAHGGYDISRRDRRHSAYDPGQSAPCLARPDGRAAGGQRDDQDRCARAVRDQSRSGEMPWRPEIFARISFTASTWSRFNFPRCANGATIFRGWSNTS